MVRLFSPTEAPHFSEEGWVNLGKIFEGKGRPSPNIVGVKKLEGLDFRDVSEYWQVGLFILLQSTHLTNE